MALRNKTHKKFGILNILLFICGIGCLFFYDHHGGLWLKGVTSAWFALLGFVNLCYGRKRKTENFRFLCLVELGLFLGMCADVLLGVSFIMGILTFALGHVCYLIAFFMLENPNRRDLLLIIPIGVVSIFIVTGTPWIQIDDPMLEKLLVGYAVIISCMLGKAISNLSFRKSPSRWLACVGSVMFWFSDLMLAIDLFGTATRLTWILCSYTYWPAQNILALSLFHFVNEQRPKNVDA